MVYKMRRYLAVALAVAMVVTCLPFGLLVRADGQKIYYLYIAGHDDEGEDIYDVTTEYPDDGSLMGIYVEGGTYDFEEKGGMLIANNAVVNIPVDVVASGNVEYRLAGDGQIVTDFGIISTNEEAYTGEITYDALRTRFFNNNVDGRPAAPAYNLRVTADLELDSSMRIDELVVDKDVMLTVKAGDFGGFSQAVTVMANSAVINGTLKIESAPDGSFGLNGLYINEGGSLTVAQSGKITGSLGTLIEMRGGSSFTGITLYERKGDSIVPAEQGDEARYLYDEDEDKWIADHAYNSDRGFFAIGYDDRRDEMNNPEAFVKLGDHDVIPYCVYHYDYVEGMKMTFTLVPPERVSDMTPIVEDSYGNYLKVTKNGDDYILEFEPGPEGFNLEVYWTDFEALNPDEGQVLFDVELNGSVFYVGPDGTIIDSKQDPFNMNHMRYLVDCSTEEDITLRFSPAEDHSIDAFYYNWARYDEDNIEDLFTDHPEFTYDDESDELVYTLIRDNLDSDRTVFFVIEADDAEFGPYGPHFSEGEYGVYFNDWRGEARVMMDDADLISGYYGYFEEGEELTFVLIPPKSREAETPVVRIRRENIEDMESTLDGLTITQLDADEHSWEFKYTPETTEGFIVDVEWSEYDILGPAEDEFMIEFNSNSGFASFETDPNPDACVPEPGEGGLNGRGNKMTFTRKDIAESGIDLRITLKEGSKIEVIKTMVNDVENEYVPNDRELPEGDGGRKHMSDCDWFSEKDGVLTISIPGDLEDNFVWIDIEYEGEYGPGPDAPCFHDNEMQVFYDDRGGDASVELGGEFVGTGWFGDFESGDEFTFTLRSPEVRWGETPVVRIRQESGIRSTEGDDGLNPVTPVDADKHVWEFTYTADGDEGFIVDIEWSVYDTYGAGPDEFAIEIENNPEFGDYAVTTGYGGSMQEPNGGRCWKFIFDRESVKDSGMATEFTPVSIDAIDTIWIDYGNFNYGFVADGRELEEGDNRQYMSECEWISVNDGVITVTLPLPEEKEDNYARIHIEYYGDHGPGPEDYFPEDGKFFVDYDMRENPDTHQPEATVVLGDSVLRSCDEYDFEAEKEMTFTLNPPVDRVGEVIRVDIQGSDGYHYATDEQDEANRIVISDGQFTFTPPSGAGFKIYINWSAYDSFGPTAEEVMVQIGPDASGGDYTISPAAKPENIMTEPCGGNGIKYLYNRNEVPDGITVVITPKEGYAIDNIGFDGEDYILDGREKDPEDTRKYISECDQMSETDGVVTVTIPGDEERNMMYLGFNFYEDGGHDEPHDTGELRINAGDAGVEYAFVKDGVTGEYADYSSNYGFDDPLVIDPENEPDQILIKFVPAGEEELKNPVRISVEYSGRPSINEVRKMPADNIIILDKNDGWGVYRIDFADEGSMTNNEYKIRVVGSEGYDPLVDKEAEKIYSYEKDEKIVLDLGENVPAFVTADVNFGSVQTIERGTDGKYSFVPENTAGFVVSIYETEEDLNYERTVPGPEEMSLNYRTYYRDYPEGAAHKSGIGYETDPNASATNGSGEMSVVILDENTSSFTFVINVDADECRDVSVNVNGVDVTDQITDGKFVYDIAEYGNMTEPVFEFYYRRTYSITAPSVTGGTTDVAASAKEGTEVTVTATPSTGYELSGITVKTAGNVDVDVTDGKFIMPSDDVTVTASFSKIDYTVTAGECQNGSVSVDKATANYGDVITVTATPATGYELDTVKVDGTAISGTTFTMPAADVTVTATFKKADYTVTAGECQYGSVSVDKAAANYGDVITVTATPATGYELNTVKVDGTAIAGTTFTMPAKDVTVTATFKKINYTVTVEETTGGTVVSNKSTATYNTKITLTVTPDEGYELDGKIKVNGSAISGTTFKMPASNATVTAAFKKIDYTVTVAETQNGTVTVSKATANMGDEITVTVTPATGYELDTLSVTGAEVTDGKFTMPASDVTVTATFKKTDYTVTVAESQNGTVTVSKATANMGDEITVTVTPATGYELDTLSVTGATVTDGKFTMPASNVTVTATFKKTDYTITIGECVNGSVSVSQTTANYGDVILVTATPDEGYELIYFQVDGGDYAGTAFNMPAKNVTVTATFRKADYSVTVGQVQNGSVSVDKTTANYGDVITVTATPAEGYELDTVKVDGTAISGTTFTMPAKDVTVTAVFKEIPKSYTVSLEYDSSMATVSGITASTTAHEGDQYTFKVTPVSGYKITSVKANDTVLSADSSGNYKTTQPAEDLVIKVTCEEIPVTYEWVKIGSKWYYIDSNGNKTTGFATIKGTMYFFDATGAMKTGWISEGGKWYYADKSGALQTEWKKISKVWYYFGSENGEMFTGVQKISGTLYWFKDSGALAKGWYKNDDGTYYYFTTDGAVTGWKQISKVWYYFDKSTAIMVTGVQKINGSIYLFASSGAMQKSGWKQDGDDWYYLNKSGAAYVSKWLKSGKKWYYFKEDGRMACNESLEIDGKVYEFDGSGAMK